jgi:DNA-binding NtrC family response regulator
MGVRMPGMDGVETLKEIKRCQPLVEIIMLTGLASVETATRVMELGAFDYLLKPIEIDQLIYKIQDAYLVKSLKDTKKQGKDTSADQPSAQGDRQEDA